MSEIFDQYFSKDGHWAQFQLYGIFPEGLMLMLAGSIKSATIHDGRLAFACGSKFRAEGDKWERLPVYELFLIPGRMERLHFQLSSSGRLGISHLHPKESVITVLFPEKDAGDPRAEALSIVKLDLQAVMATAVETYPGFEVVDNAGEQITFPCGHVGHERWMHRIFGRVYKPTGPLLDRRERCGQCWLEQQTKGVTRCHACRGPILVGDICWNYDGNIFCNSAKCSAGPAGSWPHTWSGTGTSLDISQVVCLG